MNTDFLEQSNGHAADCSFLLNSVFSGFLFVIETGTVGVFTP